MTTMTISNGFSVPESVVETTTLSSYEKERLATKPEFAYSLFRLFASGATIRIESEKRTLDAAEKRAMLYLLKVMQTHNDNYAAIRQAEGIRKAKEAGKYTGRKRQPVDPFLFEQVTKQFRAGDISEAEAMQKLNINARSTLYRRMREVTK